MTRTHTKKLARETPSLLDLGVPRHLAEKVLLGAIIISFTISLAYSFIRYPALATFSVFFNLTVFGLALLLLDEPGSWYVIGGLSFFSYLIVIIAGASGMHMTANVVVLLLFIAFIASTYFLGPRSAKGDVLLADSKWAVVKTDGSPLAGIPKGIYGARSKKGISKGDTVLVEVSRKWGEREMKILRKS